MYKPLTIQPYGPFCVKSLYTCMPHQWAAECQNSHASAGSRTRIDCLEGNHANRYTTNAEHAPIEVQNPEN